MFPYRVSSWNVEHEFSTRKANLMYVVSLSINIRKTRSRLLATTVTIATATVYVHRKQQQLHLYGQFVMQTQVHDLYKAKSKNHKNPKELQILVLIP